MDRQKWLKMHKDTSKEAKLSWKLRLMTKLQNGLQASQSFCGEFSVTKWTKVTWEVVYIVIYLVESQLLTRSETNTGIFAIGALILVEGWT